MSNKYDLTVCICAYNAEKYIVQTLDSLWNQTFKDFYLWIVDDASTDKTAEISKSYLDLHQWINAKVISLPENGGLAAARYYAEKNVETEYIGFIDADDIAEPLLFEHLYNRIKQDIRCQAVSCYCKYISDDLREMKGGIFIGPKSKEEFFERAKNEKLLFMPSVCVARINGIIKAGYHSINGFPLGKPRYQDMCEDLDLWTRMSDSYVDGSYLIVLPEILLKYRRQVSSVSAFSNAMSMRIRHIKKNLKLRRSGQTELTYCEFIGQLTKWERIKYSYVDWSQHYYKKAGFFYIQKKYIRFFFCLFFVVLTNPMYLYKKIKANIMPSLKKRIQ